MGKNFNILMVGVGGQGIILASNIISRLALIHGLDVKKNEIHGMSQRGGSVFSHIRFGEKVYFPIIPEGEVDILISLEEMETIRWIEFLNKDTKIFLTDTRILPAEVKDYPENIKEELQSKFKNFFIINQKDILEKVGKPKFVNTGILGFVSNYLQFSEGGWKQSIKEEAPEGSFDENWKAFLSVRNYN